MSWKELKIENICIVGDGAHASINRINDGVMYLSSKNFNKEGIVLDNVEYISEEDYKKHFRDDSQALTKPKENDLIFSIIGSIGGVYRYKKTDRFGLSSSVAILRVDKKLINTIFLSYYLKSDFIQKWIEIIKSGSAQGFLSLGMIKKLPLKIPEELFIQVKIANILSNYDNLIENNNKRIKLLENMAEELYKEWFVRLRFPNYQNTKIVDGIPDGWEKKKLDNYLKFFRGKSYSSEDIENDVGLPFVNLKCINRNGGFKRDGLKVFSGKFQGTNIAYSGDIIMAVTDMTQDRAIVGRVGRIPKMNYEKFVFSMDTIRIEPIDIEKIFLYILLRFSNIGLYLKEFANGANVLHLTPDIIYKIDALIPTSKIQIQFTNIIKPILDEIDILELKNQNLKETRDLLLPRLISGKLDIKDLHIV